MEIEPADLDSVELGSGVLMRGYVFLVKPGPDALREVEMEDDDGELINMAVGFAADECPPCSGDCLAPAETGYLVVSEYSKARQLARLDGWLLERAELAEGWRYDDPTWKVTVVVRESDGQLLLAGSRGWDD